MGSDELLQFLEHYLLLPALDHSGEAGQQAGGVGNGDPGPGVSVVDGHDTHEKDPSSICYLYYPGGKGKSQFYF